MSEWRPMETAPKNGIKALWWVEFDIGDGPRDVVGPVIGYWDHDRRGFSLRTHPYTDSWHERGVRAWMPLPQPPEINPPGQPCDKRV